MLPSQLLWLLLPIYSASAATVLGQQNTLDFESPSLEWAKCGEELYCANLTVPMDWEQPDDGRTIQLYLNKLNCKDPSRRIGSLILNPGGPGGSASEETTGYAAIFSDEINARFDLIGLDPRGVGFSSPVVCDDSIKDSSPIQNLPVTQKTLDAQIAENRAFAQSCLKLSGDIVKHVDTINVAKDMEAVRIALGGEKLNYVGTSYGTMIGSTYASLFPDNIRALVMDGNLDHTTGPIEAYSAEATSVELSFGRFADWCNVTKACALHDIPGGARAVLKAVTDHADKVGYKFTANCEPTGCAAAVLRSNAIVSLIRSYMYVPTSDWPFLAHSLRKLYIDGDVTSLEGGGYTQDQQPFPDPRRSAYVFTDITCLDWNHATTLEEFIEFDQLGRALAPYMHGITIMWNIQKDCVGWPFSVPGALNKEIKVSPTIAPIVVVQSTYDPATPYQEAVNLQRQIPNSVLLTRDGDGHASYPYTRGVQAIVDKYLLHGILPAVGTVVPSNSLGHGYGE